MDLIPPKQPETPAEQHPSEEPRLLLRRSDDGEREDNGAPRAAWYERKRPGLLRPQRSAPKADGQRAGWWQRAAFVRRNPNAERVVKPRRKFSAGRLAAAALMLVALIGLSCELYGLWLRHEMRAALPQLDGQIHVPGLSAPVTVTRNAQGVPSIHAANLDDLLFAQGFVTAQDRLWQMDMLRRFAAGDLAEIFGPSAIDHDRQQRYLQLREAADRAVATMPDNQLHQLQDYARGVNAFIDSHSSDLPVQFHLLSYKPRPWQPRDSVLVELAMWQDLSTSFPDELNREALAPHLPASLANDLYPTSSWRDLPPSQPPVDLSAPKASVLQIPLDPSQSALHEPALPFASPSVLLGRRQSLTDNQCAGCRAGSNNWVISAARSATGAPLLANDMHLNLSAPDIWYEASLHLPGVAAAPAGLDVTGFTLPGLPFVVVGRNAHIAWSFTNLGGDVQDLYIEHLRGRGANTEFERADGTWAPVEHHTEHISVRGGLDVTLDVMTTTHGTGAISIPTPIISPLYRGEHRAISLAWTAYDPAALHPHLLEINQAADGASLVAAFAQFGGPSLNLIYADDQHHIGYHAIGMIPIRGSAVPQPRPAEQMNLPTGAPPVDDNDQQLENSPPDASATPQAMLNVAPALTLAAWHPDAAWRPGELPRLPQTERRRLYRRRVTARAREHITRERRRRIVRRRFATPENVSRSLAASAQQPGFTQTITPAPGANYTIGSQPASVPVDALDTSKQWSGYIPYDQLPAIVDPASGVLATANGRITPDDYPYYIANDWPDSYRVDRIHHLLDGRDGLTPQDMLSVELDIHSSLDLFLAQRLSYAIDHASSSVLGSNPARLRQAADILRSWDGEMSAGEAAPAITAAFRAQIWQALLVPQIRAHDGLGISGRTATQLAQLYTWQSSATALEKILNDRSARWLPPGFADWNDFLTSVLKRALTQAKATHNLSRWKYGSLNTAVIDDPLLGRYPLLARVLGVRAGTGTFAIGGDAYTIRASGHRFGPSERFIADLSNPDASTAVITTGESGSPASAWFLDQFPAWRDGTMFALPLDHPQAEHTLTLLP